jgi:hypothetical protein
MRTRFRASLALDLMATPNHKGRIVGLGEYQLDIRVAAENAPPVEPTNVNAVFLRSTSYGDETTMLRDGVGIAVL